MAELDRCDAFSRYGREEVDLASGKVDRLDDTESETVSSGVCKTAQQASLEAWADHPGHGEIATVLLFRHRDQPLCRPLDMDRAPER
jgi:hypothetical protein